jgi:membrane-bound ClpP family serine protease
MDPLLWSVLLLFIGLALVCVEVFVPSGGVLGFLSITCLVTGIGLAFYHRGAEVGFLFLAVTAVLVPVAIVVAFRYWPKTPMGRRLLLDVPTSRDVLPDSPRRQQLRELVGKRGVAKSLMMPSGAVVIGGQTFDALSEGIPIEAGQPIKVIEVRGTRVLVRPLDGSEPADERPSVASDDVLSQPIESLGLDSLDDPLA